MITQERLKSLLHYEPTTGIFTWKVKPRHQTLRIGEALTSTFDTGYSRVKLDQKTYRLHRLAFLYMTGSIPDEIDHINRIKTDNRWCNLREASRHENMSNLATRSNTITKVKGLANINNIGYQAGITSKNKRYTRYFHTITEESKQEAIEWLDQMRVYLHGEFGCK